MSLTCLAKTDCKEVTDKCETALEARKAEVSECEKVSEKAQQLAGDCALDRKHLEEDKKKAYRNPLLMSAVGATAGLIVGGPIVIVIGFLGGLLF